MASRVFSMGAVATCTYLAVSRPLPGRGRSGWGFGGSVGTGQADVAGPADGLDVPARADAAEAGDPDAADLVGDDRIQDDLAVPNVEAEHGAKQEQRGPGRPRLRAARRRIR